MARRQRKTANDGQMRKERQTTAPHCLRKPLGHSRRHWDQSSTRPQWDAGRRRRRLHHCVSAAKLSRATTTNDALRDFFEDSATLLRASESREGRRYKCATDAPSRRPREVQRIDGGSPKQASSLKPNSITLASSELAPN